MAACANKILNKTDNTSRATVSSPVWGDLAYKAWSCNIFNYPSSQVLGTGSFIVLALSFTVTLWSNICFPIYVVFPALINLTSPRGKNQIPAFSPLEISVDSSSTNCIHWWESLVGKKAREEIEEIRMETIFWSISVTFLISHHDFLINQHDLWAMKAEF